VQPRIAGAYPVGTTPTGRSSKNAQFVIDWTIGLPIRTKLSLGGIIARPRRLSIGHSADAPPGI